MKMGVFKLFNSLRLRCNHTYCIAYIAVYTNYVAFLGVYCHSMFCVLVNVSTAHHRNSVLKIDHFMLYTVLVRKQNGTVAV